MIDTEQQMVFNHYLPDRSIFFYVVCSFAWVKNVMIYLFLFITANHSEVDWKLAGIVKSDGTITQIASLVKVLASGLGMGMI